MKTRVTFRVAPDLAEALRVLPNQTQFVEQTLREALREKCPACGGTGRATQGLRVSNFRARALPALRRGTALQLRSLVGYAKRAAATELSLRRERSGLAFVMTRGDEVLLTGAIDESSTALTPTGRPA